MGVPRVRLYIRRQIPTKKLEIIFNISDNKECQDSQLLLQNIKYIICKVLMPSFPFLHFFLYHHCNTSLQCLKLRKTHTCKDSPYSIIKAKGKPFNSSYYFKCMEPFQPFFVVGIMNFLSLQFYPTKYKQILISSVLFKKSSKTVKLQNWGHSYTVLR